MIGVSQQTWRDLRRALPFAAYLSSIFVASVLLGRLDQLTEASRNQRAGGVADWAGMAGSLFSAIPSDALRLAFVLMINLIASYSQVNAERPAIKMWMTPIGITIATSLCLSPTLGIPVLGLFAGEGLLVASVLLADALLAKLPTESSMADAPSRTVGLALVLVNTYSGLYLIGNLWPLQGWIAVASGMGLVYSTRAVRFAEIRRHGRWKVPALARAVLLGAFLAILYGALSEYGQGGQQSTFAPAGEPWRSLYFAVMLSLYAVLPITWRITATRSNSPALDVRWAWPALATPAVMVTAVPFLTTYTPHGLVLLGASSIWLIVAYLLARTAYQDPEKLKSLATWWNSFAILAVLFLFLIADRIWYLPISKTLSPAIPAIQTAASVVLGLATIYVLFFSPIFGKPKALRSGLMTQLRQSTQRRHIFVWDVAICACAFAFIAYFYGMYQLFLYDANLPTAGLSPGYPQPAKEGFGSVYAASWGALVYLLNLVAVVAWVLYESARATWAREQ